MSGSVRSGPSSSGKAILAILSQDAVFSRAPPKGARVLVKARVQVQSLTQAVPAW